MVYLTHYEEYPIYEPAEGGYYYPGNAVVDTERLSLRQAKRKLKELFKELKEFDEKWEMASVRFIYRNGKYIGEGESYVIERKLGSCKSGWEPYC